MKIFQHVGNVLNMGVQINLGVDQMRPFAHPRQGGSENFVTQQAPRLFNPGCPLAQLGEVALAAVIGRLPKSI